jgi:hypothetical protein
MPKNIFMKRWTEKNGTAFQPEDLGKNEGRGERKYAHELCLLGLDATQNAPGQNPDILIKDGPGREIKQLDRNRCFRLSASKDVMLAVARYVVRPLMASAERRLESREFDLLTIGNIKNSTLKKLRESGPAGIEMDLFTSVFEHGDLDFIVLCFPDGYVEFGLDDFVHSFDIYNVDKFVAKVRLREGVKIFPPA